MFLPHRPGRAAALLHRVSVTPPPEANRSGQRAGRPPSRTGGTAAPAPSSVQRGRPAFRSRALSPPCPGSAARPSEANAPRREASPGNAPGACGGRRRGYAERLRAGEGATGWKGPRRDSSARQPGAGFPASRHPRAPGERSLSPGREQAKGHGAQESQPPGAEVKCLKSHIKKHFSVGCVIFFFLRYSTVSPSTCKKK